MSSSATLPTGVRAGAYRASVADTPQLVRAAQRLRHQVFAVEHGARLDTRVPGLDVDEFDAACDHLVVEHQPTGELVGTYRLLPPGRRAGLYADTEFDLGALDALRPMLIEAGRSCVHPEHRTGAAITTMWSALGRYALLSGHRYLAGCASVPLADGGAAAAATWRLAETRHSAPAELRVRPHRPWLPRVDLPSRPSQALVPPLLRGYLRLGALVCGPPAHDPEFGVADFFVLLRLDRIDRRYLRYFGVDASAPEPTRGQGE
ncbi:Putative hemolysin [Amycolatopsis arida]|uniref:Putative hemolysin n=1 Tax=Amycolatopsis arida TaxID=587909 RepID=A0A1I5YB37_9PSEU|nr:GNAT family N-acyltransferase [Amycolatopsis arida]TDX90397.1 putative hemolysin [Amycolatopsis arida]SFQ41406.1 Putative hemolysin [Amycolatopsis arida]